MHDKLVKIQNNLKAPKTRKNTYSNFQYRSAEDILEAVKPLLLKEGLFLTLSDTIEQIGDSTYVKSIACVTDGNMTYSVTALAKESTRESLMDDPQRSGAASSYARKYALGGLFLIDSSDQDPDSDSYQKQMKSNMKTTETSPTKWLSEGGDGEKSTTQDEFIKVETAVKQGKIQAKDLRRYYKVSKDTMEYFKGLNV